MLLGYVLVLGSSSVGHGWQLLTHLAHHHHGDVEATERAPEAPHQHEGRTHTHESPTSDAPPAALLTFALDKHCLFGATVLFLPADRGLSALAPAEMGHHAPRSVETPPPRGMG